MEIRNLSVTEALVGKDDPEYKLNNLSALASAVSWASIFAGAAAAAALSLILLILGVGLGLSSVSPWVQSGISAKTFGISTILWITLTQVIASGMGGYLAGRLRSKWIAVHTDEVYFRDTAHGFLAWAIASLGTAALLTSAMGSIIGSGVQAGAVVGSSALSATTQAVTASTAKSVSGVDPINYFVDSIFRKQGSGAMSGIASASSSSAGTSGLFSLSEGKLEVAGIFLNNGRAATLPPEDLTYVGRLVAQYTGLNQQDAEKRVGESYGLMQAKLLNVENATREAAEKARKASTYATLWLFISLLLGAFFASLAALYGGRQRDSLMVNPSFSL